jgi:acetyl esterase/lipase
LSSIRFRLLLAATCAAACAAAGCTSLFYRYVNRGLPPPDAAPVYAPEFDLAVDVYAPEAPGDDAAPVVVFFYGGSWQNGSRERFRFVGHRLASNGILTMVADYRTYPRAAFPAFMDDSARAVAYARAEACRWGGDPDRLFVAGHSAGAQIAALLATDERYLDRHGLQPRDLSGVIGLSGPYDFAVSGDLIDVFGPESQWPLARPVNFVNGDEPPFLLIHGTDDRVVSSAVSVEMARKLRDRGAPARLELLNDGGHATPLAGLYDPGRAPAVLPLITSFVAGPSSERTCATSSSASSPGKLP